MKAKIELYEPLHDHLKTKTKWGKLKTHVWVVTIGPVVKICPSESAADRYLHKMGFTYNIEGYYEWDKKSVDQLNLEMNYKKISKS